MPRHVAALQDPKPMARFIDAHVHLDEPEDLTFRDDLKPVAVIAHLKRKSPLREIPNVPGVKVIACAAATESLDFAKLASAVKAKKIGCIKIYLGYVHKWATDKMYRPYYKFAEKHQIPVVFHTGDTLDKMGKVKYADPLTIDEIAVDYPKVTFVLAHVGNPWISSAAEVVYKNDNVYADVSALLLGDISKLSAEVVEEMVVKPLHHFYLFVENPKKILFGTDYPDVAIGPYMKAVQRAIPEEHWHDVFYANAARVFKIETAP